jgi:DNA-binding MarR family transcriptional regulator
MSETKQAEIDLILENLFAVMPIIHRKLLRMDLSGVTGDMTRLHMGIMGRLYRGSMTVSELAQALKVPPPQISHLVDYLVKVDVAARQPDASDRRVVNIVLTDRGMVVLKNMHLRVHDHIRKELSGLTSEELAEMSGALECLRRIGTKL